MSNKNLVVINHPDSVALFSQIEEAHKMVMSLVQDIFEHLDTETAGGVEWAAKLQLVQEEEQTAYEASLKLINQNNVMHTTILVINEQQASMMSRLENLEAQFGSARSRSRQHERDRNDHYTREFNRVGRGMRHS